MKARVALLGFLTLVGLSLPVLAAHVYGTVYDSSLNPVLKAVVTLNTTPEQRQVALNGSYEFFVPAGEYRVQAMVGNVSASENLNVNADGEFRVDLIALEDVATGDASVLPGLLEGSPVPSLDLESAPAPNPPSNPVLWLVLLIALAVAGIVYVTRSVRSRRSAAKAKTAAARVQPLRVAASPAAVSSGQLSFSKPVSADQRKMLDVIGSMDGRVSQKELRKALAPWSEAKVSMELTELEDGGLIRKIKKGRGNIIRLA
ncbi:Uncharacterised protein [uncultured archaeon]|nr:Uncharacterised protein [uncultured archaeon]